MNTSFANLAQQGQALLDAALSALQNPPQPGAAVGDAEFERMYGLGYHLLAANQPEQALSVFACLFAQRPTEPRVLSGFGHCFLRVGDAAQAAVLHSLAYAAQPDHPGHILAMAEDLIAMESPMAPDLLQAAEVLASQTEQYGDVAERARALRDLMNKRDAGTAG